MLQCATVAQLVPVRYSCLILFCQRGPTQENYPMACTSLKWTVTLCFGVLLLNSQSIYSQQTKQAFCIGFGVDLQPQVCSQGVCVTPPSQQSTEVSPLLNIGEPQTSFQPPLQYSIGASTNGPQCCVLLQSHTPVTQLLPSQRQPIPELGGLLVRVGQWARDRRAIRLQALCKFGQRRSIH